MAVLALRPSDPRQAALADSIQAELAKELGDTGAVVELDTTGSIGKRYRRQDEVCRLLPYITAAAADALLQCVWLDRHSILRHS